MKQFKFVSYLLVAVLCLGFASCSSDDDEINISSEDIIGTWEHTYSKGYRINKTDAGRVEWDLDRGDTFFVFNDNNTGNREDPSFSDVFSWKLETNKIIFQFSAWSEPDTYTIKSLTADKLIFEEMEDTESYYYYSIETYTKIN